MPATVAITISGATYLVATGTRTVTFDHVNDAIEFARHHLRLAQELRESSAQLHRP